MRRAAWPDAIRELLDGGLLHADVATINGQGLASYTAEPHLHADGSLDWRDGPTESGDESVLRGIAAPFSGHGGLKVLHGDLGQAIIKTSAIADDRHVVEAPARVFHSQEDLAGRLPGGYAHRRLRRRGALSGAEGQRHAGAAQARCPRSPFCRTAGRRSR